MTQPANGNNIELKRIVRMLQTTVEMAQDAELTGSLADKSAAAVRSYNRTVSHLLNTQQIPAALFSPLPDDSNLTDVAMSSAQLAEYLAADLPDEEGRAPKTGNYVGRSLTIGNLNLGGGDSDELTQMIRENLAEWFGEPKGSSAGESAVSEPAGAAPEAGAARSSGEPAANPRRAALPPQARVEELRTEGQTAEVHQR
jgi:hypothetical protein